MTSHELEINKNKTEHTAVTTLILLLLEGELLKSTELFNSITGIINDLRRTVTNKMINKVQGLWMKG